MPTTLVLVFLAVFVLAIGQAVVRRLRNPFVDTAYEALPDALRTELERIAPGFQVRRVRTTKYGDEARLEGDYLDEPLTVEADFDRTGAIVELELDRQRGTRTRSMVDASDLPEPAAREIERVLGGAQPRFQRSAVTGGSAGGEACFKVKGTADDWRWDIEVSASGRLLEVEKEKRRR